MTGRRGKRRPLRLTGEGQSVFSYFGQDGREDGEPRGASVSRERTGSPSDRAPGKN